jgi:hypothetical protein
VSGVPTSSPDIATIAANLGVFTLAVMATVGGIYKAMKNIKKGDAAPGDSKLQSGVILENVTMQAWSESNRVVAESNDRLRASNYAVRDKLADVEHQIERVRDAIADGNRFNRRQDT